MKFGHPHVDNPSGELDDLTDESTELMNQIDHHVKMAKKLVTMNRIVQAQMRDCHLTVPEQIAQLDALNEMETDV